MAGTCTSPGKVSVAAPLQSEVELLREELARAQVANATLAPLQLARSEVAAEGDLASYLSEVLRRAAGMVSAEAGSLLLLDEDGRHLEFAVVHGGGGRDLVGKRIPASAGVAGWCLEQRRPLVVNDPARDPRYYTQVAEQTDFATHSLICVPLIAKGKAIGVLEALNKAGGQPFNGHDISLLWAFASQVALAIGRKQAEEALRRERDFIGQLVDTAPVAILVLDADGAVVRTNPYFETLCGYSIAELGDTDWVSLLFEAASLDLWLETVAAALTDAEPLPVTLPIVARHGERREVEWRLRPLSGPDGAPIGTLAIGLDITEANRAAKLRAATYEIAQAALEADDLDELFRFIHAIIAGLLTARNFVIAIRQPPSASLEYVYCRDERLPSGAANPYVRAATAEVLRVARSYLGDDVSLRRLLPDGPGEAIPSSLVAVPLRLKAGTIGVLALHAYDTSARYGDDELRILSFVSTQVAMTIERKLSEEAARENEERWQLVVRGNNDGIWDWDLRKNRVFLSRRWQEMLGYAEGELSDDPEELVRHVHPQDADAVRAAMAEHIAGKSEFLRIQHRAVRKDGSTLWVFSRGKVLLDSSGTPVRMTGSSADISESKQAEEDLRQLAAELARSNADLEQFAYAASHDLQEPLRTVSSFVQLLARRYEGKLDSDADQFMYYITDAADRMQTLIDDLLTYSRVQTRAKEPRRLSAEVPLLRALASLQGAIAESGAVVTHDPLPVVKVDAGQLARVFQNLIGNAIKFRSERPCRIHVSVSEGEDDWTFSVSDNGIGFDPQFSERIFAMFQRLHTRAEYPGSGMGLAICRKIVERHGGRMWAESEEGVGARFCFTLPKDEGGD